MDIAINGRAFHVANPRGSVQAAMSLTKALKRDDRVSVRILGYSERQNSYLSNLKSKSQTFGLVWEQGLSVTTDSSEIDLLLCPNGNAPIFECSVPTVVVLHDLNAFENFTSKPYEYLQRFRVPRMLKNADAALCVSEYLESRLRTHFSIDIETFIIYNGIDKLFFNPPNIEIDGVPDEYILFVGGNERRKNINRLLKSYQKFRKGRENPPSLVLVGAPKKRLDQSASADLSGPGVVRLGFITKKELAAVYDGAKAFVFPSLLEWFGLPPVEAMATGTPVISSNQECMPEILGDAVEYVSPYDINDITRGISKVVDNDEYRSVLKDRGYKRAKNYSWKRASDDTIKILSYVKEYY
jgi:glycosyltransferase involved in cell wall biosynthesis